MPAAKHTPRNERVKRRYFDYLQAARGQSEASVNKAAAAIARFEASTGHRDFGKFHIEQALAFRRRLAEATSPQTGARLSAATASATLAALRAFFIWLADQPGYRRRIHYADADYFRLSEKESRIAKARREQPVPSVQQVRAAIRRMPATTDIEWRNRALLAFTLLTGARDGATIGFRLKHVDLSEGRIMQDARDVATKFSKTFPTWFFPVGDDIRAILDDWVGHLRDTLLFGPDDPLFPATCVRAAAGAGFRADGLTRRHWTTAGPLRQVFRDAFTAAGLPAFLPHSFRKTLATLGEQRCTTPEQFKAWSQNLGHEHVLTTFTSYGAVAPHRQAELIRNAGATAGDPDEALARRIAELVRAGR